MADTAQEELEIRPRGINGPGLKVSRVNIPWSVPISIWEQPITKEPWKLTKLNKKKSTVLDDRLAKAEAKKRRKSHHVTNGTVRSAP